MNVLIFIALVILLIGVALFAERELYRRRAAGSADGADVDAEQQPLLRAMLNDVREVTNRLLGGVRETGQSIVTPEYVKLMPSFKRWIDEEMTGHNRLRNWLLSLPNDGFKALTGQIVFFCNELNIELEWLIDGELDVEPRTRKVVEDIVISYCDACLKAVQIQPELNTFRQYQHTLAHLGKRGDKHALGQQLLARLSAEDLAPPPPAELVLASDDERRAYALSAIREATQRDREKFNRIWDSVMTADSAN